MPRTILVLPDGTEISSGTTGGNAIQSVTITEMVNDSQELNLGSACAAMVEIRLFTPAGGLPIAAGDELTVYREDDNGTWHKVGLFTTEKPTRPSANTMQITAYDRVIRLDKDLTLWLAGLNAWPYRLYDFAKMVCEACGLTLVNTEIPNGDYLIRQFSADGITGRQLIRWVGQIAGRFCRATADGEIEFAWYTPVTAYEIGVTAHKTLGGDAFTDDGSGNIAIGADDILMEDDGEGNIAISGELVSVYDDGQENVFLTIPLDLGEDVFADDGNGNIAITVDDVQLTDDGEGNVSINSGLLSVYDDGRGGVYLTSLTDTLFYFMNSLTFEDYVVAPIGKVQLRQNEENVGTVYPDTAEALNTYIITGNYLLTNSAAEELVPVAQTLYEGLQGMAYTPCKVSVVANTHIRAGSIVNITDRNGKKLTAYVMRKTTTGQKDTLECTGSPKRESSTAVNNQTFQAFYGKVLNLRADVDGLKVENKDTAGNLASLKLDIEGIATEVSKQQAEAEGIRQSLTTIQQNAESVSIQVRQILDNGTDKLKTGMGYTFDDEGMHIAREGNELSTLIDHTGMQVSRSGENVLQATAEGVKAIDITVRNYLIVGNHARFEDYTDGSDSNRTACFFINGG